MPFTLAQLRSLKTGDIIQVGVFGPCRFLRMRQRRAVFLDAQGGRVNIWLDWTDSAPPPALAAVRDVSTPAPAAVRTDDE